MGMRRTRSILRAFASTLSVACFLTFSQATVTCALAAETGSFESWPKKSVEVGVEPSPTKAAATETGSFESWPKKSVEPGLEPPAAKAGDAAGAKTASGISAGTWGWIAAGTAALLVVVLVAAGGNNGTTSSPVCNQ